MERAGARTGRNTAVMSYPDLQQLTNNWCGHGWGRCASPSDTPLRRLRLLRSRFAEQMPHNARTIAQAAWDIWFSNGAHHEVMVWVDNVHRGTGGARVDAHARFAGQAWTLENYGGEIIWSLNKSESRGTVQLLPMLRWLQHHRLHGRRPGPVLPTRARLGQVDFGWEICSTGGAPERFRVSAYKLTGAAPVDSRRLTPAAGTAAPSARGKALRGIWYAPPALPGPSWHGPRRQCHVRAAAWSAGRPDSGPDTSAATI